MSWKHKGSNSKLSCTSSIIPVIQHDNLTKPATELTLIIALLPHIQCSCAGLLIYQRLHGQEHRLDLNLPDARSPFFGVPDELLFLLPPIFRNIFKFLNSNDSNQAAETNITCESASKGFAQSLNEVKCFLKCAAHVQEVAVIFLQVIFFGCNFSQDQVSFLDAVSSGFHKRCCAGAFLALVQAASSKSAFLNPSSQGSIRLPNQEIQ